METSNEVNELAEALSKMQGELGKAEKSGKGNYGKHAKIEDVINACRVPLADNDLSVVQVPRSAENGISLQTRIMHKSGQWLQDELTMAITTKATPHEYGKLITYMRRYALAAILAVAQEDDDAQSMQVTTEKQNSDKPIDKSRVIAIQNLLDNDLDRIGNFLKACNLDNLSKIMQSDYDNLVEKITASNKKRTEDK